MTKRCVCGNPAEVDQECRPCSRVRPRARNRALTRLAERHRDEYDELYREETRRSRAERWSAA